MQSSKIHFFTTDGAFWKGISNVSINFDHPWKQ